MIQMATERDLLLFQFWVRAGNGRGNDFIVARMLPGLHHGMQVNLLAARQAITQGARRFK
jgi:hypothetical protein